MGSPVSTSAGLVWPGILVLVCLVALLVWVLLFAAVLISSGPGWRVCVWWRARPLAGFPALALQPSHFSGHGSKFSGGGKLEKQSGVYEDVLGTLALVEMPSPLSCDTYLVLKTPQCTLGNKGQIHGETSFHPFGVFLVSHNPLVRFGKKMLWHLWIDAARHLGPSLNNLAFEVFNICGFLNRGGCALDTDASFLALLEHRLVPQGLAVRVPALGVLVCLQFGPLPVRILVTVVICLLSSSYTQGMVVRCCLPAGSAICGGGGG